MSGYELRAQHEPITDAHAIKPECRCPDCWQWWDAVEEVWVEGSPREPEP